MCALKLGTSGISFPPIEAGQQAAQADEARGVDFIVYWDQLNLTIPRSIWTPDLVPAANFWHVDTWMEPWPAMTAAALVTKKIEFMTVCDSLRRPSSIVAQLALTLGHVSKGRFLLCMGAGERKQFSPYGIPRAKPFGHLEEGMKIIQMFFDSSEPINYDGPLWQLKNAVVGLDAYNGVPPRMMVAGGPGKALSLAAQYSSGWFTYLPASASPEQYAEQVQSFKKQAEQAGKDPDDLIIMAGVMGMVAQDENTVDEICRNPIARWDAAAVCPDGQSFRRMTGRDNPLGADWSYPRDLIPMDVSREDALAIIDQVTPDDVRAARLAGTPEQVAAQVQPYIDAGATHVLVGNYAYLITTGDYGDATGGGGAMVDLFDLIRKNNP